jgi:hypothetical protein
MFGGYNMWRVSAEVVTCLEFIIWGDFVGRNCDMYGVYNMWGLCGEDVTCLGFLICGDCVERF